MDSYHDRLMKCPVDHLEKMLVTAEAKLDGAMADIKELTQVIAEKKAKVAA